MDAIDAAQLVTSGTAVAALGAAFWQVRSSRLQALNETTHAYIARLSEVEFVKHLARSMDSLRVDDPSPEGTAIRWQAFQGLNHERQLDVAAPFNAFESIAGLYNLGHLNREIVERQIGNTAKVVFDRIRWWIERAREQNPSYFHEWETMLTDCEQRRAGR
jgi:hypothetical protein